MYHPLTVRDFLDRAAHVYPDRVGVGSDGEVLTASNHNLDDEGYLVISDRKAEEFTAHCRTRLAGFTTPKRIDFVGAAAHGHREAAEVQAAGAVPAGVTTAPRGGDGCPSPPHPPVVASHVRAVNGG
ncbi:hypothetical protein ACH4Y0_21950 [Streptomyces sp. NPDC020707]|uniref:hypothetical protein n=1 Tax=Streptomyces sp. NPDC020707 TaxID=3365084 RepID=UPI003795BB24